MKNIKLLSFFLCILFFLGCNHKKKSKDKHSTAYSAVDYSYPADSTVINKWIKHNNFKAMYKHSWSIWQHLTNPAGDGKLEYQTWSSPTEIIEKTNNPEKNITQEHLFKKPSQFGHALKKQKTFDDTDIVEVVAYNKASEKFAIENKIFYLSTLKALQEQDGKYAKIPDFPSDAINIKPVYKIITEAKLDGNIYTMSAWNGPEYHDEGYPESAWNSCVHVDISESDSENPNGRKDYTCNKTKGKNPENTYFLNDFIHFKITENQAITYNKEIESGIYSNVKNKTITKQEGDNQFNLMKVKTGDIALLVGMHVTSKEIKRWVWQSYWWSPTPLTPNSPSSTDIASARNGIKLQGAANHYAMGVAYSMLIPAQPYEGGKNEGELVVAFNPYLESGFGEDTFTGSTSYVYNRGEKIETDLGVTTNCVSCHMGAIVDATHYNSKAGGIYYGDTYLSYKDPIFRDKLMLDFAWSIQSNIDTLR